MAERTLDQRLVVVRDLELTAKIGVYTHERQDSQLIRINLELAVDRAPIEDRMEDAVSYDALVDMVKALIAAGHVNLVETLAERIADACLDDARVESARVRVEKLHAVAEATGVGAEIVKSRSPMGEDNGPTG